MSNYIVIPDLHGQVELTKSIIKHIKSLYAENENLVAVFLGDYIDKGKCDENGADTSSVTVLKEMIKFKSFCKVENFKLILLKGNHEEFLQNYVVGGDKNVKKIRAVAQTIKAVENETKKVKREIIQFLVDLKMYYKPVGQKLFFCHAGIPVKMMNRPQNSEFSDLLNIRASFYRSEKKFPIKIIFGHSIFKYPLYKSDRIGLDCGAYRTSELTFLRIIGGVESFYRMDSKGIRVLDVIYKP